jgi:thiamine-phosphate pyrophosphorylase
MAATARILDANLNRAREALRVMEDASRFALNDQTLARDIKRIRHDLRAATDSNCAGLLEANRDSLNDVGTANTTSSELARKGLLDIVIAAGKRLTEALRVIEEFLKIDNPESAEKIKSLRYRAYDIDARLQLRFGTGMTIQWKLCVLLTESMCRHPWREVLRHVIQAGADCIQVREKNLQDAALLDRVREVIAIARPFGVSVIVNDRVDIALAAGADGVHVGQGDLSVRQVRQIAGRNLLVGVSTHDLIEARDAVEAGADYCGVGAMFSSTIKPEREPSGMKFLREFVAHYPSTPHLAIGGITLDNIAHVRKAGAQGIAVSTAICASENPGDVTRSMLQAIAVSSSQHNPPSRKVDSRSATPLPQD